MSVTVKLIVASSFIFGSLSLNTEPLSTPYIWLPDKDNQICYIKKDQCNFNDISKAMQQTHNNERIFVPMGATNMLLMELDDSLQKKAQQYAETCLKSLESRECPLPTATDGEVNISVKTYEEATALKMKERLDLVIQRWLHMSEPVHELINSFTPENRILRNWANFIHADVWKFGCGIADFSISETNSFIEVFVCFYGPPKLELGQPLYEMGGGWCSNCPIGSTCLKEGEFANKLCKMEPSEPTPIFDEPSSEMVTSAEDLVLQFPVWEIIAKKKRVKKCKDQNQCLSSWRFYRGNASIKATGVCKSTVAFHKTVYIERRSCFKFLYYKKQNRATSPSEVMAFAFVANSPDLMPVHTILSEDNTAFQEISLDIPWDDVDVYVGFGTRSELPDANYSLTLRKFKILNGNCS